MVAPIQAVVLWIVVISCLLVPRVSAQSLTITDNVTLPLDIVVFVPCADDGAGEEVALTGRLHVLMHITTNANGGLLKAHLQPQGVIGTGLVTGDQYRGTGVTQSTQAFAVPGPHNTLTLVNNFRIIGSGRGNNLLLHETLHITVNAHGDVTVAADKISAECR